MKKFTILTAIVIALAIVWVGTASANGGPHGGYAATTDACAGCHRTHTAPAAQLLIDTDPALCLTCHGAGAAGASTDVQGGLFDNSYAPSAGTGTLNAPLKGGGFTNWKHELQAAFGATTSTHNPTAAFGTANATGAWGNGAALRGVRGAAVAGGFRCSACHDPHGSTNYRIIRTTVNGAPVNVKATGNVADEAGKSYTTDVTDRHGTGISAFCAACHSQYHKVANNQGSTVDGGTYTHRIDMAYNDAPYAALASPEAVGMGGYHLPVADNNGDAVVEAGDTVTCLTCHVSHGTSAAMANWAAGAYDPPGAVGAIPSGDSALLRLPNRGVCQVCHQK